jgi:hypothetical protein
MRVGVAALFLCASIAYGNEVSITTNATSGCTGCHGNPGFPALAEITPRTPTGVTASDDIYTDRVLVSWNDTDPRAARYYDVYRSTDACSTASTLVVTVTPDIAWEADNVAVGYTYDDFGAAAGTTYNYCVRGRNAAFTGTLSAADAGRRALAPSSLSVSLGGTGSGTVTSDPAGIDCGADCSEGYDTATAITLTATPAPGSEFTGWDGGGCSGAGTCQLTLNEDTTVTATFTLQSWTLDVTRGGNGSGDVACDPAGIDCGEDCIQVYDDGTAVTLTATPAAGSDFSGWNGGGCSGTGTCQMTLHADTTLTATFTLQRRTLGVTRDGTGSGTVASDPAGIDCGQDCGEAYDIGTAVTLTVSAAPGAEFTGWTGGGCSGTGTCQLTLNADTTVTATFRRSVAPIIHIIPLLLDDSE